LKTAATLTPEILSHYIRVFVCERESVYAIRISQTKTLLAASAARRRRRRRPPPRRRLAYGSPPPPLPPPPPASAAAGGGRSRLEKLAANRGCTDVQAVFAAYRK